MRVILPPSETKSDGGSGAPLDLAALSFPEATDLRRHLVDSLVELSADLDASRTALGLGKTAVAEVERNAELWEAPTRPAIERYTGVLYDALAYADMSGPTRTKARDRLLIGSALFGVLGAGDAIPAYRLSAGSKLPGEPTLATMWKPVLTQVWDGLDDFLIDLRSGAYQNLGKVPGAVTVTVMTEKPDGTRSVVSHFNKHHKGLVARELVATRRKVADINTVAAVLADAGQRVEIADATTVVVVTE
ncbi:MAG: peroxide stress protein YaaA [Gordonia sp. (in: high G+C Gram-positive bacteria)]|uniref:peroxide stress protein YaaA n=1 Tax=Gordonia sp. (in: high G+C Gram-positive bacteria) TaxID=84139 RepID=UPI0039E2BB5D